MGGRTDARCWRERLRSLFATLRPFAGVLVNGARRLLLLLVSSRRLSVIHQLLLGVTSAGLFLFVIQRGHSMTREGLFVPWATTTAAVVALAVWCTWPRGDPKKVVAAALLVVGMIVGWISQVRMPPNRIIGLPEKRILVVLGTARPLGGTTDLHLTADPEPLSCGRTRYRLSWVAGHSSQKRIPVMMTTESSRQKARLRVFVSRTSDGKLPSASNELLSNPTYGNLFPTATRVRTIDGQQWASAEIPARTWWFVIHVESASTPTRWRGINSCWVHPPALAVRYNPDLERAVRSGNPEKGRISRQAPSVTLRARPKVVHIKAPDTRHSSKDCSKPKRCPSVIAFEDSPRQVETLFLLVAGALLSLAFQLLVGSRRKSPTLEPNAWLRWGPAATAAAVGVLVWKYGEFPVASRLNLLGPFYCFLLAGVLAIRSSFGLLTLAAGLAAGTGVLATERSLLLTLISASVAAMTTSLLVTAARGSIGAASGARG